MFESISPSITKSVSGVLALGLLVAPSLAGAASPDTEVPFVVNVGVAAHPFVRNHGQARPEVQYTVHSYGGDIHAGNSSVAIELTGDERGRGGRIEANFVGVEGLEFTPGAADPARVNIYRGAQEQTWLEDLETYTTVSAQLHQGLSLELAATGRDLQWRFEAQSLAALGPLAWRFADAQMIEVDPRGALVVTVPARDVKGEPIFPATREIHIAPPLAWDVGGDTLTPRAVRFVVEDGQISLAADAGIKGPIHLEVTLRYSPRQGSADLARSEDALWATGTGRDQLLAMRLGPKGRAIESLSVFAGSSASEAGGLSVTEDGRVWLAGTTWASDFPTYAAIQPERAGASDAVLVELDDHGMLLSSTYFGGVGRDAGNDVEIDPEGRLWLATRSEQLPELPLLDLPFITRLPKGEGDHTLAVSVIDENSLEVIGGTVIDGGGDGGDDGGGGGVVVDLDAKARISINLPLTQLGSSALFPFSHSDPYTGCSAPNGAWGQEALCWKARARNVPYNPNNVHPLLTGSDLYWGSYLDLEDAEADVTVFPNGDPAGSWQGAYATISTFPANVATSGEELALAAALYMYRWNSPVYVNQTNLYGGAVGLHEVVFNGSDPTQSCSTYGFLPPGTPGFNSQPIYQVAANCSANAAFAIHGMTISHWDQSGPSTVYHPSAWHAGIGGFVIMPNYDNHYVGDPPPVEAHMTQHFTEIAAQLADMSAEVQSITEVVYEEGEPVAQQGSKAAVLTHLARRRASRRAAGTDALPRI